MKLVKNENQKNIDTVSDKEAEEAFIKILRWIGEDPTREGLLETPKRVTKAFKEYFKGYSEDPKEILNKTFGDVNGDGYQDLIIGDSEGKIHLFNNNGSSFNISTPNLANIDVGYFASPHIVDVNRDGMNDLIIGNKDGTIYYFENKGTQMTPDFSTEYEKWGNIDVDSSYISNGFSSPKLVDINGDYHLFVGSYSGKTYLYNNIDGNINGTFNELNSISNNIWEGGRTSIAINDINNDDLVDMIIGNQCGGAAYFQGDTSFLNTVENIIEYPNIIFPNPSNNIINIDNPENKTIDIYNMRGEIIIRSRLSRINTEEIAKGIYLLRLDGKIYKFIKE